MLPVGGFHITGTQKLDVSVLAGNDVPRLPRGWTLGDVPEDAQRFRKIREN
jgi:hypothetical protein